VKWLAFTNV
jgi:hypothetical protein